MTSSGSGEPVLDPDPAVDRTDADGATEPALGSREFYRNQMLTGIGGWSGMVIAAVPTVVFVVVNALTGLRIAIISALASGVLLAGYRKLRGKPTIQALSGLFGVAIAAFIAYRTGQARGYFLFGIITSFGYAGAFLVTVVVRRPVFGLLWEFLDPTPLPESADGSVPPWYRVARLRRAYDGATLLAVIVLAARAVVQLSLFNHNATGWLAFARIAMGYPLTIVVLGLAFWLVKQARRAVSVETA
jgi:hypothetical protein